MVVANFELLANDEGVSSNGNDSNDDALHSVENVVVYGRRGGTGACALGGEVEFDGCGAFVEDLVIGTRVCAFVCTEHELMLMTFASVVSLGLYERDVGKFCGSSGVLLSIVDADLPGIC